MSTDVAPAAGPDRAPLSARLCDGVAVWFGVWTVCAHAIVAMGGSLRNLLLVFAVAIAVVFGAIHFFGRRTASQPVLQPLPEALRARTRTRQALQLAGLAGGFVIVAAASFGLEIATLWWSGIGLLAFATAAFLLAEPAAALPALRGRGPEIALWTLAAICVLTALAVHRPDYDDAFYINVAVAAADFPDRALLSRDTMLGVEGLPLHMPAHRIHTYELWNGALAYLTGVRAIFLFHWFAASLFAALVALAHARLFRLLTPRIWPWTLAALVVVLVGVGETHRWFGNFALVRIWQGKGIFLFVFMPLVYSYAIEFALRPSWSRFGLLFAAQTAAVGCSSSAVWAAPVGAWMAMCCVLRPTPRGLLRLAAGAASSLYVIAVGLSLKGDLAPALAPMLEEHDFGSRLEGALHHTLGDGTLWLAGIAALLATWALCPRGLAQRFAIALPFATWLILLNPYLDTWVSGNVTGPSYWRAMWALPLPALLSLALVSPLQFDRGPAAALLARAATVAACLAFVCFVPEFSAISERNAGAGDVGIRIGRPGRKVPEEAYRWAAALNRAVEPGSTVVAPPDIGMWLPTLHRHAHPLQARRLYLARHRAILGDDDVDLRIVMTQFVGGGATEVPHAAEHFARGLRKFDVSGVLLKNSGRVIEARHVLKREGFERRLNAIDYEIWVRD